MDNNKESKLKYWGAAAVCAIAAFAILYYWCSPQIAAPIGESETEGGAGGDQGGGSGGGSAGGGGGGPVGGATGLDPTAGQTGTDAPAQGNSGRDGSTGVGGLDGLANSTSGSSSSGQSGSGSSSGGNTTGLGPYGPTIGIYNPNAPVSPWALKGSVLYPSVTSGPHLTPAGITGPHQHGNMVSSGSNTHAPTLHASSNSNMGAFSHRTGGITSRPLFGSSHGPTVFAKKNNLTATGFHSQPATTHSNDCGACSSQYL